MKKYEHLKLPLYQENIDRKKNGRGSYSLPNGRNKGVFSDQAVHKADEISSSFAILKRKFSGRINPSLIWHVSR